MNRYIVLHLILGPLFTLLSFFYISFLPKSINFLYGYRTKTSMRSQETWDFSNKLSAKLFLYVGLITMVAQATYHVLIPEKEVIIVSSITLVALIVATIPIVEFQLAQRFDNQGKPKKG